MYRGMTVGLVIPAYNEEGYVGNVIDDIPEFVDRAYVIDDGSTDDTWAEIRHHAERRNEAHDGRFEDLVVPIAHEENRGVGGALKTGYMQARDEGIEATAVLGGDDQMDPQELTNYLDPIADGEADYTKGNRFTQPEDWARMPKFRLLGNVILSYLTKVASGYWQTMDSQNGYTAISLRALEETDIEGMYEYYGYCNDLLVRLNTAGMRVADVPRSSEYAYSDGWKSHIDYKEYIPRVSAMLFSGFLRRIRRKYLLTNYDPTGPLYLLGMGTMGTSAAGALASLVSSDEDTGPWVLSTLVGIAMFLYATIRDQADNEHLEVRAERSSDQVRERSDADDAPPREVPAGGHASDEQDSHHAVAPRTNGKGDGDNPETWAENIVDDATEGSK